MPIRLLSKHYRLLYAGMDLTPPRSWKAIAGAIFSSEAADRPFAPTQAKPGEFIFSSFFMENLSCFNSPAYEFCPCLEIAALFLFGIIHSSSFPSRQAVSSRAVRLFRVGNCCVFRRTLTPPPPRYNQVCKPFFPSRAILWNPPFLTTLC